jgi:hypothetical protein
MMSQVKAVAVVPTFAHFLGHLGRMAVFFCTAGFAYPNVMIEGLDPTAIQALTQGDLYKKKA